MMSKKQHQKRLNREKWAWWIVMMIVLALANMLLHRLGFPVANQPNIPIP